MSDQMKRVTPFKSSVATAVAVAFLFSTVFSPVAEANFWQERRQAAKQSNGAASQDLYAQAPAFSGLIPSVGSALPAAALPSDLAAQADRRRAHIPSWLRALPSSQGEVRAVYLTKNPATDPLVVLIQDVHEVESAQRSIAGIIGHVETEAAKAGLGPVLVGLEGAAGPLDVAPFRARIGQPTHKAVTEVLLRGKVLSGPEYHAFLADKEPRLWGVETPAGYMANVNAYRAAHPTIKEFSAILARMRGALDAQKSAVFSQELKSLDKALEDYSAGRSAVADYVGVLAGQAGDLKGLPMVEKLLRALKTEKNLDFDKVEKERASLVEALARKADKKSLDALVASALAHRAGRIGYGDYHAHLKKFAAAQGIRWADYPAFEVYSAYVLEAESIDKHRLFDQIEALKRRAVGTAAKSPEEKNLMALAEDVRLLRRLARHEFSPEEWASFAGRRAEMNGLEARVAGAARYKESGRLTALLPAFEDFYAAADARNHQMTANLAARAAEEKARVRVLVAGGFHTPGLEKLLKAQGSSFVTITPHLEAVPAGESYLGVFTAKHVPLEQMLLGQKLFLALERHTAVTPMGVAGGAGEVGKAYSAAEAGIGDRIASITDALNRQEPPPGMRETAPGTFEDGQGYKVRVDPQTPLSAEEAAALLASGKTEYKSWEIFHGAPRADLRGEIRRPPVGGVDASAFARERLGRWARWWSAPLVPGDRWFSQIPRWAVLATAVTLVVLWATGGWAATGTAAALGGIIGVTTGGDGAAPRMGDRLAADLRLAQSLNSRTEWENGSAAADAPEGALADRVYNHLQEFIVEAKRKDDQVRNWRQDDPARQAAYLEILEGISFAVALPQLTFAIPTGQLERVQQLRRDLTDLWVRIGKDLEIPRINAIETLLAGNKDAQALGVRGLMAQANVIHTPTTQINPLPPDIWSPYSAELWAPYMTPAVMGDLILGLGYNLDADDRVAVPDDINQVIVAHVFASVATDKTDPTQRLSGYSDFEANVLKAPEQGLALAKKLGIPADNMTAFEAFSRDFKRAMTFVKRAQLWTAKRDGLPAEAGQAVAAVRQALGARLQAIDDRTLLMRLVALNRPWPVIVAAARGEIPTPESFGGEAIPAGLVGTVPLAAGAASRWGDSMVGYVKAGLMTEDELSALKGPRQTTAFWVGRMNGIGLGIDSMATNGGGRQSFLVSPFTYPDIFEEAWRQRARHGDAGKKVLVDAIVQNSGEAMIIDKDGHFLTDQNGVRRLDGKVLGHGNIRGFPLGILSALTGGQVYGLVRAGDAPLAQVHHPVFQGLIRRMVSDARAGRPRVHVAVGNWRSPGQTGGGLVDVAGVPNVVDTRIPKKPNPDGFVADRDITVFSTFENVLNYAGVLYAIAGDLTLADGDRLITWNQYAAASAGDRSAIEGLGARIRRLTPEQVAVITDRYINLLPSEYVEKKEGDTLYVQWEQISGMLHGSLAGAISAALAREQLPNPGGHSFAYIDISLDERDILKAGDPTFAEVKSGPGLSAVKKLVAETVLAAAERGLFSDSVRAEALADERRAFSYEITRRLKDYEVLPASLGVSKIPPFAQTGELALTLPPDPAHDTQRFWVGNAGSIESEGEAQRRVAQGQVVVFEHTKPNGPNHYLFVPTPDFRREMARPPADAAKGGGGTLFSPWIVGALVFLMLMPLAGGALAASPDVMAAIVQNAPAGLPAVLQVASVALLGAAAIFAYMAFNNLRSKKDSPPATFYGAGQAPRWDAIIPAVQTQLKDLQRPRAEVREAAMRGAAALTDEVGNRSPAATDRGLVIDRGMRALLLTGGAQGRGELALSVRLAFTGFFDKYLGATRLQDAWRAFATRWSAGAASFEEIDDVKSGVVRTILLDDPANTAMVEDAIATGERYLSTAGRETLASAPNTALLILVDPQLEKAMDPALLARLRAVRGHERVQVMGTEDAGLLNERGEINLARALFSIKRDPLQVTVQIIASPTSTAAFNLEGFRQSMVSFLVWVLAGTAVPVSHEVEKSLRSFAEALKNA